MNHLMPSKQHFYYKRTNIKTPKLTIALSTVGGALESFDLLLNDLKLQTRSDFELLVLLQGGGVTAEVLKQITVNHVVDFNISIILSETRGLLISRNLALNYASAPIILLADDDCRYFENTVETILAETEKNTASDILTFQALNDSGKLLNPKNTSATVRPHSKRSLMHVSSIEIVVRKSLVAYEPKLFDERFGLGTKYNTGGENIMLLDCLRRKVIITQHPTVIVRHPKVSSGTGKNGLEQLAFAKGAMFRRMYGRLGGLLLLGFMIHKRLTHHELNFGLLHFKAGISGFKRAPREE